MDPPSLEPRARACYPSSCAHGHDAVNSYLEEKAAPRFLSHINVTRVSPRPGTPGFELDEIDGGVVKDRSRELVVPGELLAGTRIQERIVGATKAHAERRELQVLGTGPRTGRVA